MARPLILIVDDREELVALFTAALDLAGYEVISATRGKRAMALARERKPAAAVIDILLPDLMGYDVGEALRRLGIPFAFMSGVYMGGDTGDRTAAKYGAFAYLEKPFSHDELRNALAKVAPVASPPPFPDAADEDVTDPGAEEAEVDVDDPLSTLRLSGKVKLREQGSPIGVELEGQELTVRPARAEKPPVATPPPPPRAPAAGDLSDNLPQLITAFWVAQATGELHLARGLVKKAIYFAKGRPVFALSNVAGDRFAQFLVRVGRLDADTVRSCAAQATAEGRRTSDVVTDRGLLSGSERQFFVGQQIKAILFGLFSWEAGTFRTTFNAPVRKEALELQMHPANLILQGIKKQYRPERLARLVPPTATPVPSDEPPYLLSDLELEKWEARLLARVDGTQTIARLEEVAQRPEGDVRATLVGLVACGILKA